MRVALHHHGNLTYGAIPVSLSHDIVEQGFGSKSKLAASLLAAKTWYFWWDSLAYPRANGFSSALGP